MNSKGKIVGNIPVKINYKILELFSAGLYASPHKAFEELVSNSYDAGATCVSIFVPEELSSNLNDDFIWICDNGGSMDSNGLKLLWRIGESNKGDPTLNRVRKQIGQFGIGKLSTYVLSKQLTYICKKNGEYRTVSMDYNTLPRELSNGDMNLDEKILTEKEAEEVINELIQNGKIKLNFDLFGDNSSPTWTFAVMSSLTDKARTIKKASLLWVLSTALPVNPNFNLMYNGNNLEPNKISNSIIEKWVFGQDDEVVTKNKNYSSSSDEKGFYVNLPKLKKVRGYIELYQDSLLKGKSKEMGRSHGIFLLVRKRLINTNNPLLDGMDELNHAAFNRIRIVVEADGLNEFLTSGRESVKESIAFDSLRKYLNQKFNKAKSRFDKWIDEIYKEADFSEKILGASPFYSKVPLLSVAKKFYGGNIDQPYLISLPDLNNEKEKAFLNELEDSISDPTKKIISEYSVDNDLTYDDPIAKLDLENKKILINTNHPFFMNFLSELKGKTNLPFSLIAANEIFTEANLIEKDIDQVTVKEIMERRDLLFREFSIGNPTTALNSAMMLKNSLSDPLGLEDALYYCLKSLGFELEKIGGNGKPDGIAKATLGVWPKENQGYSFTYEAKSTGNNKISADQAKISVVSLHKEKYKAAYAIEVAIDYEGSTDAKSNINQLANKHKVSVIRAKDFLKLIMNAIPNQLNHLDFKDFLETCHTTLETTDWIEKFSNRPIEKKPYKEILDGIYELMAEDPNEPPTIEAIRERKNLKELYGTKEILEIIKSLKLILPNLIDIQGNKVRILLPPNMIFDQLNKVIDDQIPSEFRDKFKTLYLDKINGD